MLEATRKHICDGLAHLALTSPLSWYLREGQVRSDNRLRSSTGESLTMNVNISLAVPGRMTFLIRDDAKGDNNAVRLDTRATHTNVRTDGRRWVNETHLHIFRTGLGHKHATDPIPPWPPAGWSESMPTVWNHTEIERTFECFCSMLGLAWHLPNGQTAWTPPPVGPAPLIVEDGEEIP